MIREFSLGLPNKIHDQGVLFGTAKQDVEERLSSEQLFGYETLGQLSKFLEFHLSHYGQLVLYLYAEFGPKLHSSSTWNALTWL